MPPFAVLVATRKSAAILAGIGTVPRARAFSRSAGSTSRRPPCFRSNHHVVFTVPDVLNLLFLRRPAQAYGLLFAAVSETLIEVAANPVGLGARIGFTAILHGCGFFSTTPRMKEPRRLKGMAGIRAA
jgi:hypothetical protein